MESSGRQVRLSEDTLQEHDKAVGARAQGPRRQSIVSSDSMNDPNKLKNYLGRRRSTVKSLNQSISMMRRMSIKPKLEEPPQPKFLYENTFRMDPQDDTKFQPHRVEPIVDSVFKMYLDDQDYDQKICSTLACDLAQIIKNRVKDLEFPRYRIVCNVMIGQKKDQGIEASSRCVWDQKQDNYACVYYQNPSIFAVAMVHGVYFE
ncbi:dynein light chain Tctex-type 5-like isoform X2 [Lineus longissimus]